jgi:hypothetical protein
MNRDFLPQLNLESPPNSSTTLNGTYLASITSFAPSPSFASPLTRFPLPISSRALYSPQRLQAPHDFLIKATAAKAGTIATFLDH